MTAQAITMAMSCQTQTRPAGSVICKRFRHRIDNLHHKRNVVSCGVGAVDGLDTTKIAFIVKLELGCVGSSCLQGLPQPAVLGFAHSRTEGGAHALDDVIHGTVGEIYAAVLLDR